MAPIKKRTQVVLSSVQHAALARLARRRTVPLAQVLREAVEAYLAGPAGSKRAPKGADQLRDLVGFIKGPGDLADRHDDYLYGKASRSRTTRQR